MLKSNIKNLKYFSLELLRSERLLAIASPRVTTGQIFETGNVFHKSGLFSTEIFGDVGTKERYRMNGHIDLKMKILHPLVYLGITTMSSLHKGIIDGDKKAVWDDSLKDFVLDENGDTGFNFYYSKLKDIKFTNDNNSDLREFKIRLTKIHDLEDLVLTKVAVLAAGLRDYTVDGSGKPSQGEVNDLYRSLINTSNMIPEGYKDVGYNVFMEKIRTKLQQTMVDIYLSSIGIIAGGKTSLIRAHMLTKAVLHGTRNVITADNSFISRIGIGPHLRFNEIAVGLFQYSKAIEPITINALKRLFMNTFSPSDRSAKIINAKNFKTDRIPIDNKTMDSYTTNKGIASYLNKFSDSRFGSYTFGSDTDPFLMVLDKGTSIELVDDTSGIDSSDYKYLRPAKNIELLYMAVMPYMDKFYASTTRYPSINQGSQYMAKPKVRTTVRLKSLTVTINGMSYDVDNYPDYTTSVYDGMSPHQTKLAKANADYDGDRTRWGLKSH